jgi:hypothetical protein
VLVQNPALFELSSHDWVEGRRLVEQL